MKKSIMFLFILFSLNSFAQKQWVHVGKSDDGSNVYKFEKVNPTEQDLLKGKTFVGYGLITINFVEHRYKIYTWKTKAGAKAGVGDKVKCGYVSIRDKATKTQEVGTLYLKSCKCP